VKKPAGTKTTTKGVTITPGPVNPKAPKATKAAANKAAAKAPHKLHDLVMKALDAEKGQNLVSIDLAGKSAIADYMVIVTGTSSRQIGGMAEKLCRKLHDAGIRTRMEGKGTGDWVIVDAGDVIIHLFRPEVREFYNLEKLWAADFSTVDYTLYQANS
jgi:ribosome-associated protein